MQYDDTIIINLIAGACAGKINYCKWNFLQIKNERS